MLEKSENTGCETRLKPRPLEYNISKQFMIVARKYKKDKLLDI